MYFSDAVGVIAIKNFCGFYVTKRFQSYKKLGENAFLSISVNIIVHHECSDSPRQMVQKGKQQRLDTT